MKNKQEPIVETRQIQNQCKPISSSVFTDGNIMFVSAVTLSIEVNYI